MQGGDNSHEITQSVRKAMFFSMSRMDGFCKIMRVTRMWFGE